MGWTITTKLGGSCARSNGLKEFGQEWMTANNGCDGCHGSGQQAKWPTEWASHAGDVVPVSHLTTEQIGRFHTIVPGGYGWFAKDRWEPWHDGPYTSLSMPTLEWIQSEFAGGVAVVVDCHN